MLSSLLPYLYSLQSIYSVKSLKFCVHKHNLPLQVDILKENTANKIKLYYRWTKKNMLACGKTKTYC